MQDEPLLPDPLEHLKLPPMEAYILQGKDTWNGMLMMPPDDYLHLTLADLWYLG